jgi:proteasome-associated ATPase
MTNPVPDPNAQVLQQILAGTMLPADEKAAVEQCVRAKPDLAAPLLFTMLDRKQRLQQQLDETARILAEPPWHAATFLRLSTRGRRALVASGSRRISVTVGPDVDPNTLSGGQPVFLNGAQNVLVDAAPAELRPGTVGEFVRLHGSTQGVLRSTADEEIVVDLSAGVLDQPLRCGDLVLYDREQSVAFEKVDKRRDRPSLLEVLPLDVRITELGGLDPVFDELVSEVTLHLFHRELAARYHLTPTKGVLLCGPPGTGKTSLVRALGEHLGRVMQMDVKALLVKPGVHRSMWFGASEKALRDLFHEAREAADQPGRYVLLFFDDVDHFGSRDHRAAGEVDARLVPCLLQEIDSVRTPRLLLIGATNRADLLDEALIRPGRFGKAFRIGRPTRGQATEIFRRHLTTDLPLDLNGARPSEAAAALIDDLVAALYAPNGALGRLGTLTYRDGSREPLTAAQIMSGALIAAAVEQAKRRGCFRAMHDGPDSIDADDLRASLERELAAITERLKPGPALQQMLDLPPDRDVVKVERWTPPPQLRRLVQMNVAQES